MTGYRRAALCLHGLSDTDRAWVLRSLPAAQRLELDRLLVELKEMGVPRDNSWLPHVSNGANTAKDDQADGRPAMELIAMLDAALVETVIALMEGEPDEVIAVLLDCHRWTWRQAAMESLKPMRRAHVSELHTDKWPARLKDAIYESLLHKYRLILQQQERTGPVHNGNGRVKKRSWFPAVRRHSWQR